MPLVSGTTILSERGACKPQTYTDKEINRRLIDMQKHMDRLERSIKSLVAKGDKMRAERDLRILAEKRKQADALLEKTARGEYV